LITVNFGFRSLSKYIDDILGDVHGCIDSFVTCRAAVLMFMKGIDHFKAFHFCGTAPYKFVLVQIH
jgi:hypothetical protein